MEAAYKQLVEKAIYDDYTVSVWDGGEWQVKRSMDAKEIALAVESVEEAELRFRKIYGDKGVVGWALVSAFGLEPEETVIDYSGDVINKIMEGIV